MGEVRVLSVPSSQLACRIWSNQSEPVTAGTRRAERNQGAAALESGTSGVGWQLSSPAPP